MLQIYHKNISFLCLYFYGNQTLYKVMKINNFLIKISRYPLYALLILSLISLFLISCGPLKPKKVDLRKIPGDPKGKREKNIREGRGFRVMSALENKGCKLYRLALYEQVRKEVEGIDPENISCVVVGSAVGMQHVAEFWKRYKGEPSIPIIAPSLRVKKEAENLGFTDVYNVESANVTDVSTFVKEFLAAH